MTFHGHSGARHRALRRVFIKQARGTAAAALAAEAAWYASLAHRFPTLLPRYLSHRCTPGRTELRIELLAQYVPVAELALADPDNASRVYIAAIGRVMGELHSVPVRSVPSGPDWEVLLYHQAWSRVAELRGSASTAVRELLEAPVVEVNGHSRPGLLVGLRRLGASMRGRSLCRRPEVLSHGDLHSFNILSNGADVRLVDPRGLFPNSRVTFSRHYDFGKVLHDTWCDYANLIAGRVAVLREQRDSPAYRFIRPAGVFTWSAVSAFVQNCLQDDCSLVSAALAAALHMAGALAFHHHAEWAEALACAAIVAVDSCLNDQLGGIVPVTMV